MVTSFHSIPLINTVPITQSFGRGNFDKWNVILPNPKITITTYHDQHGDAEVLSSHDNKT